MLYVLILAALLAALAFWSADCRALRDFKAADRENRDRITQLEAANKRLRNRLDRYHAEEELKDLIDEALLVADVSTEAIQELSDSIYGHLYGDNEESQENN